MVAKSGQMHTDSKPGRRRESREQVAMRFVYHWREFLTAGRKNVYGRVWDALIAGAVAALLFVGWRVGLVVAIFVGIFASFAIRQIQTNKDQEALNASLLKTQNVLAGLTLTADDVLKEAAEADKIAAAAEEGFRLAAERRAHEADYEAKHGRRNPQMTGTYSGMFENVATSHLVDWNRHFDLLTVKLAALGFKVVVPSEPRERVEGNPTPAAIKLICEREALDVAADALRSANASSASDSAQSQGTAGRG
jgi:hypothetical protein